MCAGHLYREWKRWWDWFDGQGGAVEIGGVGGGEEGGGGRQGGVFFGWLSRQAAGGDGGEVVEAECGLTGGVGESVRVASQRRGEREMRGEGVSEWDK